MFVDHHWQEWLTVLGYITLAGIVTWQIFSASGSCQSWLFKDDLARHHWDKARVLWLTRLLYTILRFSVDLSGQSSLNY